MNRRNFVRTAASLFPAAGWLKQQAHSNSNFEISKAAPHSGCRTLDVRGIMAMYDLPDPRPKSIWHNYQDFFMFDARKGRRYDGDFWDHSRWDHYLSLWSREGYNAIFWYGPNELMTEIRYWCDLKNFPKPEKFLPTSAKRLSVRLNGFFAGPKSWA